ncbi:hypothetical protein ABZ644_01465 [Nocardiopsis alba]|uniref:hypothetical protein n=1 Tax=Nocardiopsis alba TaxID=53437 RepID=UPI0033FCC323
MSRFLTPFGDSSSVSEPFSSVSSCFFSSVVSERFSSVFSESSSSVFGGFFSVSKASSSFFVTFSAVKTSLGDFRPTSVRAPQTEWSVSREIVRETPVTGVVSAGSDPFSVDFEAPSSDFGFSSVDFESSRVNSSVASSPPLGRVPVRERSLFRSIWTTVDAAPAA